MDSSILKNPLRPCLWVSSYRNIEKSKRPRRVSQRSTEPQLEAEYARFLTELRAFHLVTFIVFVVVGRELADNRFQFNKMTLV